MNKISDKIKETSTLYEVSLGMSFGGGYVTNISPTDIFFYGLRKLLETYHTDIPNKLDNYSNELSPAAISFYKNGVKVAIYRREKTRQLYMQNRFFPTSIPHVIEIFDTVYAMEFIEDVKRATNNALDLSKYVNTNGNA